MNQLIKSTKGVISVLVALMMTGMLSLGTFVLEVGRYQAAKTQLTEATISASSSMLASYNSDFYTRYGILAIDPERSNEISCRDYLLFNSDLAPGYYGSKVTRLYSLDDVHMTSVYNLTYPHILKRQLLTVAKYNLAPEVSQFNMYNASYVLDELQMKCQYVADKMAEIQNATKSWEADSLNAELADALSTLDKIYVDIEKYDEDHAISITSDSFSLLPSVTGTIESVLPVEDEQSIAATMDNATTLLGPSASVLNSSSVAVEESDVSINLIALNELDGYHSTTWQEAFSQDELIRTLYVGDGGEVTLPELYKNLANSINAAINILEVDRDGNLLLNSYIAQVFSNRNMVSTQYIGPGEKSSESSVSDMTFAKACCEYIFGGNAEEIENQKAAYDYIMALRLVGNLYAVLIESSSFDIHNSYSIAAHLAWAYYETCIDMQLLTEYNVQVPLSKDKLILPINNPTEVSEAFGETEFQACMKQLGYYNEETEKFIISGMDNFDYTDSLSLALWFTPNSEKLLRVADLMQLEMRYQQRHVNNVPATFLMSEQNTYCRVECSANLNSILPVISLGGEEHNLNRYPMRCVKYAGY